MSIFENDKDTPVVGSIVIKIGKRDMMEDKKYPTAYYYSNYGVVRVKRKVDNIRSFLYVAKFG